MTAVATPVTEPVSRDAGRRYVVPVVVVAIGAACGGLAAGRPAVVGLVGVAVAALVIADRPPVATVACVALVFSNAVVVATTDHGVPKVVAAAVPLLLLVTIGYRTCIEHRPLHLPPATPWVLGLLVVQAVGAAISRDPASATSDVVTFLVEGALLWLLLANAARTEEVIRACTVALVVVASLLALLSVGREVGAIPDDDAFGFAQVSNAVVAEDRATGQEGQRRHAGPIGEQNRWAQCLAMVVPLALAVTARDRSRTVRVVATLGVPALAVGIVLTYSRGAAVGLLLAAVIAMLLRWVPRAATLAALGVAVVVLAVVAPVFATRATTVVTARAAATGTAVSAEETDSSFSNRSVEASAAIAVFVHHPVVGVGPGLFPSYFQDEARRLGADRIVGVDRQAHNLYLGLAADTGILGIIVFGGAMAATIGPLAATRRRLLTRRPDLAALATGYAMAIVTYLTTGLFLHAAYIRYLWLFAGLAAAMGTVRAAEETST